MRKKKLGKKLLRENENKARRKEKFSEKNEEE